MQQPHLAIVPAFLLLLLLVLSSSSWSGKAVAVEPHGSSTWYTNKRTEYRFQHWPYANLCWRGQRPRDCCAVPAEHPLYRQCWDDFWTPRYCCEESVTHLSVDEEHCTSDEPIEEPSSEQPFLFLWDEKAGGSTFNRWLLESASHQGVLKETHISDFWWPNVMGTPFFLKIFSEERRRQLAIVSGTFDWTVTESLCLPPTNTKPLMQGPIETVKRRKVRCFVLLRDPISRFVSYWLERSDRRLEKNGRRTLADVPLEEFQAYLESVKAENLRMEGTETGYGCNREVGLCLSPLPRPTPNGDSSAVEPSETNEEDFSESPSFRIFQGPQNRLARMLDPEGGLRPRFSVAARRLRRCTVGIISKSHRSDLRAVLADRLPWIREVKMAADSEVHVADITQELGETPVKSYATGGHIPGTGVRPTGIRDAKRNHWYSSESEWLRRNLTEEAKEALRQFNDVDTPLYELGLEIFRHQAAVARLRMAWSALERSRGSINNNSNNNNNNDNISRLRLNETILHNRLNETILSNHSWRHHFDTLGLPATRFMTDGLKCLLTSRAMQCARFLGMEWPDDQDAVIDIQEVKQLIRATFPPHAAAYLTD